MKSCPCLASFIAALILNTLPASAADRFWTNAAGGNFTNTINWFANTVPGAADNANFTNNASYQVTNSVTRTNANAFFNAGSGTVTQAIGSSVAWLLTNNYVIGQNAGFTANVTHASGTLLVTNAAGNAALEVRRGTNRLNGGVINVDNLLMTNTAGKFEFNGGTLITRGGSISNIDNFTVGTDGGTPAIWAARAGDDVMIGLSLFIGENVPGSQLLITNGGRVINDQGIVGLSTNGNMAIVAGSGSVWSNRTTLRIGFSSSFNLLMITNGGFVGRSQGVIGDGVGANSNTVVVAGSGSVWTNGGIFDVGNGGNFNLLVVSNAGKVLTGSGSLASIGDNSSASGLLVVSGAGSVWSNSSSVSVGRSGDLNQLVVSNAGKVFSLGGSIGSLSGANSNSAVINGASSIWSNSSTLNVGASGSFNELTVSNSGTVFATALTVGANSTSTNNRSLLDGGTLRVTNATQDAALDIRRGTNQLNSGLVEADVLLMTNTAGVFIFNGGTLITRGGTISNNAPFNVGANGGTPAIWDARAGSDVALSSDLAIGQNVPGSQLLLTNGGKVFDVVGRIGNNSSAVSNAVFVAGTGSVWSNSSNLEIGSGSSFNQLAISNGGTVFNSSGIIGQVLGAKSNAVFVTGTGSVWSNSSIMVVGNSGSFSQLVVSNGAKIFTDSAYIGLTSHTNTVVITGPGSTWTNRGDLRVGYGGAFNQLIVSNSGIVLVTNLSVGFNGPSTNNRCVVDGGVLEVTNIPATAVLDIRHGTNQLNNSGLIEADTLLVTNTAGLFEFNGGTFNVRTSIVANAQTFFVGNGTTAATNNLVGNGTHTFSNGITLRANGWLIGNGSITGLVTVLSGATLAPGTSVGKIILSNSPSLLGTNFMEISKSGSVLTNDQLQVAGPLSFGGALTVTNIGPDALAAGDRFVLFDASSYAGGFSSTNLPALPPELAWTNKLLVDGSIEVLNATPTDRFWTNGLGGTYQVAGNWLGNVVPSVIDNANFTNNTSYQVNWTNDATAANAFFKAPSGTVTEAVGAFSWILTNSYLVNGGSPGVVTHTTGALRVTNASGGAVLESRLGISRLNGGVIEADKLLLTNNAGFFDFNGGTLITRGGAISNNSTFNVGHSGSTPAIWDARAGGNTMLLTNLVIGENVPGCQLLVTNGGKIFSQRGTIGQTNNATVVISGAGSVWSNSEILGVGGAGGNQLVITNSGSVFASLGLIGNGTGNSNSVFISGASSVWSNSSFVDVGGGTSSNLLSINNGGKVFNTAGTIGRIATANNNTVIVSGNGSLWGNNGALGVGNSGSFNQLIVTNGGIVSDALFATLGSSSTANGNSVLVAGPGSVWTNGGGLAVGNSGSFNQLVVSNSGIVFNASVNLGQSSTGNSNSVLVAGPGSVWTNGGSLTVGLGGSFNQMVVSNSGIVFNASADLGLASTGNSNSVMITGGGSVWSNSGSLTIGSQGSLNQLIVSNAGTVFAPAVTLGALSSSTNNRLIVDGSSLLVTNSTQSAALNIRRGTNQLANGGLMETDRLLLTNTLGLFEFNGGTNNVRNSTIANGQTFFVGNGATAAALNLVGNGTHSFADGLTLRANAFLTGNGAITGIVAVLSGGTLAPGTSLGAIVLSNSPSLQGEIIMEISKNGGLDFNDTLQVAGPLTYGGKLTVTNIGPDALTLGSRFPLFSASAYAGSFSSVTLPSPGAGLAWTNKLLFDGSIEIIPQVVSPGAKFYVTSRPQPAGAGPNPDGTYFEFIPINDSAAKSTVADAPSRDGSRAYLHGTNLTDTGAGFALVPAVAVPGAVYQLEHTFTSTFTNINTNAVLSVSSTNSTVSVAATDKFQTQYGVAPNSWSTIGYVTNNPGVLTPRIEFRYQSGLINAGVGKRLNVDTFRFTFIAPRPQFSTLALAGTNLVLSGSNGIPYSSYTVLASPDVSLPATNWTPVLTNNFDSSGNFIFTNSSSLPQQFYLLRVP